MAGGDKTGRLATATLPGLEGLQAGLILSLFAYQSLQVSDSFGRFFATPVWLLPYLLVPALSALAGQFAVRQLERRGLPGFLRWLAVRLVPALLVATVVSALLIGPLVSFRPLRAYLADRELWSYFLNLVFWPRFTLPGVFVFNNVPLIVNDIFWALPAIPLAVLGLCATAIRPGHAASVLIVLLAVAGGVALSFELFGVSATASVKPLGVIVGFLLGALGQVWRRILPGGLTSTAIAACGVAVIAVFSPRAWGSSAAFNALVAVPISYIVISLAAMPLPAPRFGQRYLRGLLLLGFPVQQACIAIGSVQQDFVTNLAISLPVTFILAALSWHLVEARLAALLDSAAVGEGEDGLAAVRAGRPMSVARARHMLISNLPMLAFWLLFFVVALAVMAMIIFASQPDRGGI